MGSLRIKNPVALSLTLHAALFAFWFVALSRTPALQAPARTQTWIEIEVPPLADLKKKSNLDVNAQVVKTNEGKRTEEAAPNAFLGERTQVVDDQTVSETNTTTTTARRSRAQPATPAVAQGAASDAPKSEAEPSAVPLARLGVALPMPGLKAGEQARQEFANLDAEKDSLAEQVQGGEYVKGFKQGEKTLLNTKEYVFYGYFERIRSRLDRAWSQSLRERLANYFNKGRQLASDQDYTTQVVVTLDADGQVTRVQIIGASGTSDLDDAAVKAFNDAGPFPNPPKGLVGAAGKVAIRWDFVLRT